MARLGAEARYKEELPEDSARLLVAGYAAKARLLSCRIPSCFGSVASRDDEEASYPRKDQLVVTIDPDDEGGPFEDTRCRPKLTTVRGPTPQDVANDDGDIRK